ncbi:MAG: translation initiation factor IF-3 [Deltaproteobacteria bacterium]|nr:translation initiation factor IF-3 [Deltaproteobacteria bacterium]
MKRKRGKPFKQERYRVNSKIRVPKVRVIDPHGEQLGIMDTQKALDIAKGKDLDLVEVSAKAKPPVCRIMDYGRFKYQKAKKEKAKRNNAANVSIKEIKFRPKTDTHDMNYKIRHIKRFLENGDKVRVIVRFRGREIVHINLGYELLNDVLKELGEVELEKKPGQEGRTVTMMVAPSQSK